ncbi:MAG: PRC-barrel domain-containing protein [Hyphomicrobium sp.]
MMRGVLTFAVAVAFLAYPAFAEEVVIDESVFLKTQGEDQYLARDLLLGMQVKNADGQIIGDVEDLILNADNQVEGIVMGTGGFAGFGEKRVGVHLSALQIDNKNGKVTIVLPQATKEVLDALKPFERTRPPKSLLDRAIGKAKELTDKGTVTAKDAYEKAKEDAAPALEKAKEAAKEAYEDVKEKAAPALEQAKEAAKEAYDKAREAIENPPPESTPEAPPQDTEATVPRGADAGTSEPASEATTPRGSDAETTEPASQP